MFKAILRNSTHKTYLILLFLILSTVASSVEYNCKVEKKYHSKGIYSSTDLQKWQFSVVIEDNGAKAYLSRCSFSLIKQAITCDRYKVDKIVFDDNVKIKKFYVFSSQFDVQFFSDLSFIENNGRGSIAYGKCDLVSP